MLRIRRDYYNLSWKKLDYSLCPKTTKRIWNKLNGYPKGKEIELLNKIKQKARKNCKNCIFYTHNSKKRCKR